MSSDQKSPDSGSPTTAGVVMPASRIDVVLNEIRRRILARELVPGQPLVEADLGSQMGVSKTPVREALRMLASRGLVTIVPFKGASVRVVDADFVRDVYDIRLLLEPEAVRRSVLASGGGGLRSAEDALMAAKEAAEAGDRARMSLLNRQFHETLYAECGNPIMIDMLENLRDRAALVSVAGWEVAPTWETEWSEHLGILEAAQAGDSNRAAALLRAHLEGFVRRTVSELA